MADLVYVGNQLVNIGNTSYNIQERMLEIAKKYYNIDDMNLLKSSFFGYTNEVMSDVAKNGVWHRNFLYNEIFLNTASMTSSVYNWAKMLDEKVNLAIPARMNVIMSIGKQDIIDLSIPVGNNPDIREFIIDKDSSFFAEEYKFMLENSVRIQLNKVTGTNDYSITAQYVLNEEGNKLANLESPYIKTYIESINGRKYVILALTIWQVQKYTKTFNIYSNDISELLFFDYEYSNQLAYFNVKYKYANETFILPEYFNNTSTPSVDKYCFYTFPDVNKIQIYFSALPGSFTPKYNSELILEVFTTRGSGGNFNYNVEVPLTFKFSDRNIRINSLMVTSLADSYGGQDIPSLEKFKIKLINKLHTRNSIISEKDLNLFFSNIIESTTVYDSVLTFIKNRDDVLRRSFTAYVMLKDKYSQVLPTNTVDMIIPNIDEFLDSKETQTILSGNLLKYNDTFNKYEIIDESEDIDQLLLDGVDVYSIPFTINVKTVPFPRISYLIDITSQNIPTSFDYINPKVNYEFLIPEVSIRKLDFLSHFYTIDFTMGSNMEASLINQDIKIRCILFKNERTPYGYFDFVPNQSEVENEYLFTLKTSRNFDNSDNIEIISEDDILNYIKKINIDDNPNLSREIEEMLNVNGVNNYEIIPSINLQESLYFKLVILVKDTPVNNVYKYRDISNASEIIRLVYNQEDLQEYSIVSILSGDNPFNLFRNLSNLMYSEMEVNPSTLVTIINKIPVLYLKYFNNDENYTSFYDLFNTYVEILRQNLSLLEQNTKIDIRFFNTYGPCKYSSIDRVNINLELNIKLNGNSYTTILDTNIKNRIIELIESFNLNQNGLITISGIFVELARDFSEISFIEFVGLNDYNISTSSIEYAPHNKQRIELIVPTPLTHDPMTIDKEHLINFVPEFINIPRNPDYEISTETNTLVFQPTIKINYLK